MPKTYVLDTNVLLHNPMAIHAFSDNDVVIPLPVIEEIDNCKKAQDEIGRHARIVSRELDALRETGSLSTGVRLKNGGSLRIELNHQKPAGLPAGLDGGKYDNRILSVALGLSHESSEPVLLVTKNPAEPSQSALSRYVDGHLVPLSNPNAKCWGLRARNKEQKFAMELLLDNAVRVLSLVGRTIPGGGNGDEIALMQSFPGHAVKS